MGKTKQMLLNFFPLQADDIAVRCYRRQCKTVSEARPGEGYYHFREDRGNDQDTGWWLTCEQMGEDEEFVFSSKKHPSAAKWVLTRQVLQALAKAIDVKVFYWAKMTNSFWPKLNVGVKQHDGAGWQGFVIEFDWNPQLQRHGIYVNFHFFRDAQVKRYGTVQKLSLSLDANGQPNRDLYRQQYEWLKAFYGRFLKEKPLTLANGEMVSLGNMVSLDGRVLEGKTFEFAKRELNRSAYWGIKKSGPYQGCTDEPTFFFVFREFYRPAARFLYECLLGREFHDRFPGMTEFFGVPFDSRNVRHIIMEGGDEEGHENAAKKIAEIGCKNPVAIVLVTGSEEEYLIQKSAYLKRGIPSQDVQIDKVRRGRSFQWSVAGVALQLFCKAGGIPWCVQTRCQHDLIIGVSQLWCEGENGRSRFIAYSVTTDANGFFKDIRTLANSADENDYVADLSIRIKAHLIERIKIDMPERIVLHCSFRLKKKAMDAIRRVAAEVKRENVPSLQIVIMRVNNEHRYEAFDTSRETMVPDENTVMEIKRGSYLVWPDGTPAGGVVSTRPSSPLYVVFDRVEPPLSRMVETELLQGMCNLSGVNWRGFNAKARPVSVFYCQLVGRMMSDMAKYDLKLPEIEKLVPWFL